MGRGLPAALRAVPRRLCDSGPLGDGWLVPASGRGAETPRPAGVQLRAVTVTLFLDGRGRERKNNTLPV